MDAQGTMREGFPQIKLGAKSAWGIPLQWEEAMSYKNLEEFQEKNPDVRFSNADRQLAASNDEFAQQIINAKGLFYSANGDAEKEQEANKLAETARALQGSYLGGADGSAYQKLGQQGYTSSPYAALNSQLNGAVNAIRSANNASVNALEGKQDYLRYDAKKQKEGVTAGYFQSLSSLDEHIANSGYSALGGQSRTLRADAVSDAYSMQNDVDNSLRSALVDIDIEIGQLIADGKTKEAQALYDSAQIWLEESRFQQEQTAKQQQQEVENALAAGKLTGTYNGQDTLDKQKYDSSLKQFEDELSYKYSALNQKKTTSSSRTSQQKAEDSAAIKDVLGADSMQVTALVENAKKVAAEQESGQSGSGLAGYEQSEEKWIKALMYIDQTAGLSDGIAAIYELGVPTEVLNKYLHMHYSDYSGDLSQVTVPGQMLYLEWYGTF